MDFTVEKIAGWATIITALFAIPSFIAIFNDTARKFLADNQAIPAALAALIIILCFIGLAAHLGWFRSTEFERIVGRQYKDQTVTVDGKLFEDCTFENVTFRLGSNGRHGFIRAKIIGSRRFETPDLGATAAVNLLKLLGYLEPAFAESWRSMDLKDFK